MEQITFTEDELIQALINAQELFDDDVNGALTTDALSEKLGWSIKRVRARLRRLNSEGRLEVVQKPLIDIAGRRTHVPAYRIIVAETE